MEHARDYDAYARRKRNVFSLDLNVTNDKLFLMSIGIVFHSFGAATEKARVARTVSDNSIFEISRFVTAKQCSLT